MVRRVAVAALLVFSGCVWEEASMPAPSAAADPLMDVAERDGSVDVLVQLAVPQRKGAWPVDAIRKAQRQLMDQLGPGARALKRSGAVPQILLRVGPAALQELRQSPLVVNITAAEEGAALE